MTPRYAPSLGADEAYEKDKTFAPKTTIFARNRISWYGRESHFLNHDPLQHPRLLCMFATVGWSSVTARKPRPCPEDRNVSQCLTPMSCHPFLPLLEEHLCMHPTQTSPSEGTFAHANTTGSALRGRRGWRLSSLGVEEDKQRFVFRAQTDQHLGDLLRRESQRDTRAT